MRKHSLVFYTVVALGSLVIAAILLFASRGREHWFMVSTYAGKSTPIEFYGQVVDQAGKPIPEANISLEINQFDPSSLTGSKQYMKTAPITLQSDSEGKFVLKTNGMGLYIKEISHPSYIKIPEDKWEILTHVAFFGYWKERGVPHYVPDPTKPAVFPLRMQNESRLLWPSRGGTDIKNSWSTVPSDTSR